MTFQRLLHDLIGLTGRTVTVTASTEGTAALTCSGVLGGGFDLMHAAAGKREALYFPLADAEGGFLLAQRAFTDAAWEAGVLHVELGPLTLSIEPIEDEGD